MTPTGQQNSADALIEEIRSGHRQTQRARIWSSLWEKGPATAGELFDRLSAFSSYNRNNISRSCGLMVRDGEAEVVQSRKCRVSGKRVFEYRAINQLVVRPDATEPIELATPSGSDFKNRFLVFFVHSSESNDPAVNRTFRGMYDCVGSCRTLEQATDTIEKLIRLHAVLVDPSDRPGWCVGHVFDLKKRTIVWHHPA